MEPEPTSAEKAPGVLKMTFADWVNTESFKYKEDFDQLPDELKPQYSWEEFLAEKG